MRSGTVCSIHSSGSFATLARSAWPIKTNLCLKKAGSNRIDIGIIARAIAARAGAMDSNANDFAETDAERKSTLLAAALAALVLIGIGTWFGVRIFTATGALAGSAN